MEQILKKAAYFVYILKLLQKNCHDKTVLLIDNDLTLELSDSFGIKTKNTIYGVKSGKHEYKILQRF